MSEYGTFITHQDTPLPLLTSDEERIRQAVKETKEQRRKVLEAVMQRRRENYKRFMQNQRKHRLLTAS